MKRLLVLAIVLGLLLAACGSAETPGDVAQETAEPATAEFKTPLPQAAEAMLLPTNTPVAAPPTPTSLPTNTPPLPTPSPAATAAESPTPAPAVPELPSVAETMVEISAGPFVMGQDKGDRAHRPAHEVDLPAYEIDKFEVTNADYAAFVEAAAYVSHGEKVGKKYWLDSFTEGKETHPVVRVTWDDAAAYCEWAGKRLPTEAEWEKAARGTEALRFPWGNDWDPSKANVKDTGLRTTVVVGSFGTGASPYGVEDMAGNVWEWTGDWYDAYPGNSAGDRYYGEQCRVTRGGGWFDDETQSTTFGRNCGVPDETLNDDLGFRCARSK
ncbi:SUMF1/EgtB/PvdO family nonheme iron enzyme [Chloroflexota bacterium]